MIVICKIICNNRGCNNIIEHTNTVGRPKIYCCRHCRWKCCATPQLRRLQTGLVNWRR